MSVTAWFLAALAILAAALCLWAWLTGGAGPHRRPPERVAQHGRWVGEGDTRRLSAPETPTEVIRDQVARGRCTCLHLAHVGRCRAAWCECVSAPSWNGTSSGWR